MRKSAWAAALLALAGWLFAALGAASAASAAEVPPFCLPGSGAGKCNGPGGLAVDEEFEAGPPPLARVFVADRGNNRVNVFGPEGETIGSFAAGSLPAWVAVDNDAASASRHDVYATSATAPLVRKFKPSGSTTYEEAASESFGAAGTGPCQFAANDPIAVGPNGNVYVADSHEKEGAPPNTFASRVIVFSPSGSCLEEVALFEGVNRTIRSLAVDSEGHMYVSVAGGGGAIRKYSPAGALEFEVTLNSEDRGTEAEGLAVDSAGHLFAKQRDAATSTTYYFTEFSPAGAKIRRFGYVGYGRTLTVPALAAFHTAAGDLYASEGAEGVKYLQEGTGPEIAPQPCEAPEATLGSAKATLSARINPEGQATTYWFKYVTKAHFEAEGFNNAQSTEAEAGTISASTEPFDLHPASSQVTGLEPETEYRCRVVAENAEDAGSPAIGPEGAFTTREGFEFGPLWSGEVGESSARIFVEGNPLETPAKGQIEYVEDARYRQSGFAEALSAPTPELDFGAGSAMKLVQTTLSGLSPGTLYHYRLRVRNGKPPEGLICPERKSACPELERTFRTYLPEALGADGRRYELVSPGQKNTAEVAVPTNSAGLVEGRSLRIQAGAGNGEAITYTSWTSFGAAGGAPSTSQYLSKRTPGGWVTENISPFGFLSNPLFPPYSGFTPELGFGAFKTTEPPLVSGCRRSEDMYRRDNANGQLACLSPEDPEGPEAQCLLYAGATEDGGHVLLAGKPEGGANYSYRLYVWTPGGVAPVSVLPGGALAPATKGTSFGPAGNASAGEENCQVTRTRLRGAISEDGTKAFWTFVPEEGSGEPTQLYVRLIDSGETVQLDKHQGAGSASGNGRFWAASADGSVAYFTDAEKLLAGANPAAGEPDLYRYRLGAKNPLADLTAGSVPGDVQGVIGASDDGSYVYFVATAALEGGEEENAAGQSAQAGEDNLYLSHEGRLSFIATLSPEDAGDWSGEPRTLSARVSPDGKHLAFLSTRAQELAGYDNHVAEGEHCKYELTIEGNTSFGGGPLCSQAFLYDAAEAGPGRLSCASCKPSGARPLGPTILPGWSNGFEGPRYLSDDGARLFFQSWDALVGADENGKSDVYELERASEGSCTAANPNFDPQAGGCHFLISGGAGSDESFLLDASADGRDAFFSTRRRLNGWDVNENYDVYDAREGGGFAEPAAPAVACEGEASCLNPPPDSPAPPNPATPSFNGPGNPAAKKPKPHRKKHHRHKGHHRKAKKKSGAKGKHRKAKKGRAAR